MQVRSLALAVAAGLAFSASVSAAPHATEREAGGPVRFLRLSDIPAALATTGRDPQKWDTDGDLRGLTYAEAAALGQPVVAWVANRSLADAEVRSMASDAVRHGLGVLVTFTPGEKRREASTFGVGALGDTALFHRGADGVLDVVPLADDANDAEAAARLWPRQSRAKRAAFSTVAALTAPNESIPDNVPHVQYRIHAKGERGSTVAHDVTIVRDISSTRDEKVIIVKAHIDVTPANNGISFRNQHGYLDDGSGDYLTIPDSYTARTIVGWESKDKDPGLRLDHAIPDDSPDVDRVVETSSGVTTSYGVSTAASAEDALQGLNISAIGKVPFEFSANRTYADTTTVSMVTQSYYTAQTQEDLGKARSVVWQFKLANDIAGDASYFNSSTDYNVKTAKMTPMMRKASTELLSVWRVPGSFEGRLWVGSGASVENRGYSYGRSSGLMLDPSSTTTPDGAPAHWWFWTRGDDPYASDRKVPVQPSQVFPIDLDSPYLTSSPTVLIQSASGAGDCLAVVANGDAAAEVALAACDATESNLSQQWNMDKEGRYRNRANGGCLDVGGDGAVTMAPCSLRLSQRWRWAADRIVALTNGGTTERLEVRNNKPFVAYDPSRHDRIVLNTDNALLPPWSNYPYQPAEGSTIPRLGVEASDVPKSYLDFREVQASERWLTIPLRRSI